MKLHLALCLLAMALLPAAQGALPSDCTAEPSAGGALELLWLRNCTVYLGVRPPGRDDVTEEVFEHWTDLKNGWSKNPAGVRYTTMQRSCLYASPGSDEAATISIDAGEPWTGGPIPWMHLASTCSFETVLGGCFPDPCNGLDPAEGSLKFYEINKCHKLEWDQGTNVSIITDPDGNKYIMHAASDANAAATGVAFNSPVLPEGWSREDGHTLEEDMTLNPTPEESATGAPVAEGRASFGSVACGYALIQDSQGNAYHRFHTTTGNTNIVGKLHLILNGNSLNELLNILMWVGIVVGLLVIVTVVVCCVRGRAQSETDETGPGAELVS